MRRHNKKGNGFYKIAETIPKYVSIDATLVKVAQNYLRKIAEAHAEGTPDPNISKPTGSAEGTTDSLPKSTSAGTNAQNAQPPTATETSALHKPNGALSTSGGVTETGSLSSGQQVGQLPGSVSQGTTSQPAGESPALGDAGPAQSGATEAEKNTSVVESPSTKRSPNYLKNLALLVGIPLTIASLASGAIRGFGMSSIIGLGLGAVATVYGFGFLDHLKDKFYKDIEKLERGEINRFFNEPGRASEVVRRIYHQDVSLLALPPDYSTKAERVPDEFKKLYGLAHNYIMDLYKAMHEKDIARGVKPKHLLHKIFGYEYRGAPPQEDILNSLNKGRDLERHATIIVLANMLKHLERVESRERAIYVFKNLLERTPYWYRSSWGATGYDETPLNRIGFTEKRPYLADPWTLLRLLEESTDLHFSGKESTKNAILKGNLSDHLMQAAWNFDTEDTAEYIIEEAQTNVRQKNALGEIYYF